MARRVGLRPCEVSSFFKAREKTLLDKRALTFLENCERYTLRSLVRRSAKHHAEVTVDHARRIFSRALKKLDTSQGRNPALRAMTIFVEQERLEASSQPFGNT